MGDLLIEGGTLAYLVRLGGRQILAFGSMNYIEREIEGLRPVQENVNVRLGVCVSTLIVGAAFTVPSAQPRPAIRLWTKAIAIAYLWVTNLRFFGRSL